MPSLAEPEPLRRGLTRLDDLLAHFYGVQARPGARTADPARLAVVPAASQRARLLEALVPSAPVTPPDEESEGFINVLPGEKEPFRAKLIEQILDDVDAQYQGSAVGRGEAEHDAAGALYDLADVEAAARLIDDLVTELFGSQLPDMPKLHAAEFGQEGNLYDQFDRARAEYSLMDEQQRIQAARDIIYDNLWSEEASRDLFVRHHVDPRYSSRQEPLNEAARLVDDIVSTALRSEPGQTESPMVDQLLEIKRGGGAETTDQGTIYIQRWRPQGLTDEANRKERRRFIQSLIHEILHRRTHPNHHLSWRSDVTPLGVNTVDEGINEVCGGMVSFFIKKLLAADPDRAQEILQVLDGEYYQSSLSMDEAWPLFDYYASRDQAMGLVPEVGIPNVLSAVSAGRMDMIFGPEPGAPRSLLARGRTAAVRTTPAREGTSRRASRRASIIAVHDGSLSAALPSPRLPVRSRRTSLVFSPTSQSSPTTRAQPLEPWRAGARGLTPKLPPLPPPASPQPRSLVTGQRRPRPVTAVGRRVPQSTPTTSPPLSRRPSTVALPSLVEDTLLPGRGSESWLGQSLALSRADSRVERRRAEHRGTLPTIRAQSLEPDTGAQHRAPVIRAPQPPRRPPAPARAEGVAHTVDQVDVPALLGLPVGAIVNPTDRTLLGQTGLSGEILRAGGDTLRQQIELEYPMGVRPGDAALTTAPGIDAELLIHAVVPDFTSGDRDANLATLRAAYGAAVTLADQLGLDIIAVPLPQPDDPRPGDVTIRDLRAAVRDALKRTPTTTLQSVLLVSQAAGMHAPPVRPSVRPARDLPALARQIAAARPAAGPSRPAPAPGEQELAQLRAGRAKRQAAWDAFRERARNAYLPLIGALGIAEVDVARDGDCFFNSIIELYRQEPERLRALLGDGQEPTARRLRTWLANTLERDFARGNASEYARFFLGAVDESQQVQPAVLDFVVATIRADGHWDSRIGETIPTAFALAARLPMTLVGRRVNDLGPDGLPPEHYIVYTGDHYMGARAAPGTEVLPVSDVRAIADEIQAELPDRPKPLDAATLNQHRNVYLRQFSRLREEFERWLTLPHPEADADPQINEAAGAAMDAITNLGRRASDYVTEAAVDAMGERVDRLASQMETLRGVPLSAAVVPALPKVPAPGAGQDEFDAAGFDTELAAADR